MLSRAICTSGFNTAKILSAGMWCLCYAIQACPTLVIAAEFYVAPNGDDSQAGTAQRPFATLQRAREAVREVAGKEPVRVQLEEGVYRLRETLLFGLWDSGTADAPIVWESRPGSLVTISGRQQVKLDWQQHDAHILKAQVPDATPEFDQLFVNGARQVRARFPNIVGELPVRGHEGYLSVADGPDRRPDAWLAYDAKSFSPRTWAKAETGIVHAFQSHNWGNMQYRIRLRNNEQHRLELGEGGWQLQRQYGLRPGTPFFVENISEELDSPGEWFYDQSNRTLYVWPRPGQRLNQDLVEVAVVKDLIHFAGDANKPVKHVTLRGLRFTGAKTTFLESYEPVSRSDWSIHRGAAVFLTNAESIHLEDCEFDRVGGNGVFFSGYNRRHTVSTCRFTNIGESAVAAVGLPSTVRNYLTWDDRELHGKNWVEMSKNMSLEPGPQGLDYPAQITIDNCLMQKVGDFGKQTAGVFIAMAHKITVSHCTIHDVPRAAICIGDGTWGGHIIEHCDIWDTVRETGEHGPINAWGRDRFWQTQPDNPLVKNLVRLDALDPVVIRHNRVANLRPTISAGNWTIDLDDGSSNYEIYNNLSLGSTLKLRDGFYRKVYNNIHVSPVPLGWHVWPRDSEDEFYRNITVVAGSLPNSSAPVRGIVRPIRMPDAPWGKRIDGNLYWNVNFAEFGGDAKSNPGWKEWQAEGYDRNGIFAAPKFLDPLHNDFRVQDNCASRALGFENFPMTGFGHHLTRITPNSGEFARQVEVVIHPDQRGGTVHYTTDGTEPTARSPVVTEPLLFKKSVVIQARTFRDGLPVGFSCRAAFVRNDDVTPPSWLASLLADKFVNPVVAKGGDSTRPSPGHALWRGASVSNIQGDADLIDAAGGWDYGVFIHQFESGAALPRWGLRKNDIIVGINDQRIEDLKQLKRLSEALKSGDTLVVRRSYEAINVRVP